MKYPSALVASDRLIKLLSPGFVRLEAVGSLRRRKPELDEIDLLGIPDPSIPPRPRAEFGKPVPKVYTSKIDSMIADLAIQGDIILTANGPRQKKFFSVPLGIRVDLYIVRPPATWGVLQMIRTGPADFAQWIVTSQKVGGGLPVGYRVQAGGAYLGEEKEEIDGLEPIGFETEATFFEFLRLPWISPEDRRARWEKR